MVGIRRPNHAPIRTLHRAAEFERANKKPKIIKTLTIGGISAILAYSYRENIILLFSSKKIENLNPPIDIPPTSTDTDNRFFLDLVALVSLVGLIGYAVLLCKRAAANKAEFAAKNEFNTVTLPKIKKSAEEAEQGANEANCYDDYNAWNQKRAEADLNSSYSGYQKASSKATETNQIYNTYKLNNEFDHESINKMDEYTNKAQTALTNARNRYAKAGLSHKQCGYIIPSNLPDPTLSSWN